YLPRNVPAVTRKTCFPAVRGQGAGACRWSAGGVLMGGGRSAEWLPASSLFLLWTAIICNLFFIFGAFMPARQILVTSALPYANGSIHIGHLVEYIQTDIWVRYQRLRGNHVTYVCGDDAHGTPIMMKAKQLGEDAKSLITRMNQEHKNDFA